MSLSRHACSSAVRFIIFTSVKDASEGTNEMDCIEGEMTEQLTLMKATLILGLGKKFKAVEKSGHWCVSDA